MKLAIEWLMTHRWAMIPSVLQALAVLAKAEASSGNNSVPGEDVAEAEQKASEFLRMSISLRDGLPIEGTWSAQLHGAVAVIPVVGPIYSGRYSYWGGGTSIQRLAKDIAACEEDPAVSSIILNMNTPGGDVTGISEVAQIIYEARKGDTPIDAYVYGLGASAGYWLGSACRRLVAADTAEVGSIGVASVYTDFSEWDKKMGIKEIEVVSSQSPNKRVPPTTQKGKDLLQTKVDDLADIFVEAVAKHRNVTTETVLSDFGQGDVMVASKAVAAGMIDEVGSLESMIDKLNKKLSKSTIGGPMNLKELQAQHPETYKEALEVGKAEAGTKVDTDKIAKDAAEKERARVAGIMELSKYSGSSKIIQDAIANPEATKETVGLQILEAQQAAGNKIQTAVASDSSDLAAQLNEVEQSAPSASEETQEIELGKAIAGVIDEQKQ